MRDPVMDHSGITQNRTEDVRETFRDMSASVVILVVLSEAALQTFEGEVHDQNNYLLFLQFALRLHDACGVRILALNLVAHDDESHSYVKFQGWHTKFSDDAHQSPWIQDSVAKSMKRLFALQGINIDLDDWEFKIPTLFASFYAARDDLNAVGWLSVLRIIPWKSFSGLLMTFALCFFFPFFGFLFAICYWKFSTKSQRHKDAHLSVSLFATGLALFFGGAVVLGITVFSNTHGALCGSQVKCEVMVRAGNRWALWREWAIACNRRGVPCYEEYPDYLWSQGFTSECATCVCESFRNTDTFVIGQKTCASSATGYMIVTIIVFIFATISLAVAVHRLQKQALVTNKRTNIYRRRPNSQVLPAVV